MEKSVTPQHVAFIMDGNRRWAKKRLLPTLVGHSKGYDRIKDIVRHARKLEIPYVTFWAFSTENWNRSAEELEYLFDLFLKIFQGPVMKELQEVGGRICVMGDISRFPQELQKRIKQSVEETRDNIGITINIGLNYGGRAEILHAVRGLLRDNVKAAAVTDDLFEKYLYTAGQPDPDLIIRTGGEERLSGYLPWQGVYSELYFTKTYWPDFDAKAMDAAMDEYARRNRRFGK